MKNTQKRPAYCSYMKRIAEEYQTTNNELNNQITADAVCSSDDPKNVRRRRKQQQQNNKRSDRNFVCRQFVCVHQHIRQNFYMCVDVINFAKAESGTNAKKEICFFL